MERNIEYSVLESEQDFTVKDYLKKKGYSAQNLIQLKQSPCGLFINRQPATVRERLHPGDLLSVRIVEETSSGKITPVKLPFTIVYEDEDLLVADKPANMPIHPSQNNYDNSLANALAYYYEQQQTPFIFRCINRLDKDTSGLTVIAKHFLSAGILGAQVAKKETFRREYLALVRGEVTPGAGKITAPIGRVPGSVIERQIDFENGEYAATNYQVLEIKNGHSLLSLKLETGRTHQIRIHMKYLGYPLIGDYLYNPDYAFISRQALHSHKLTFLHPITGEKLCFTSPLPEDMYRVLNPSLQV